ncbi:MAG: prolyl oligopeptidase family serine peptidase [Terriglobia bacterium]|jgi:predicted esterase
MHSKRLTVLFENVTLARLLGVVLQLVLLILAQQPLLAQVESKEYGATRVDFAVPGGSGFVIKPNHSESAGLKPWLWYAPTFVKATPQMGRYPNASLTWLFTRLLDKGVWIAGGDVGESCGNSQGRKAYTRFYKYVQKEFALSPQPCLLAQSRGGLMLYNWAVEHPHDVGCIAGIYPVTNLESWPNLGGERIQQAYGMSEAELRKHLRKNNPIDRLAPLARAHVPIFHIHGDADKVVSLQQNTLEFASRYNALGGKADVEVIHGKGHEEVPEFFESERLLDYLLRFLSP